MGKAKRKRGRASVTKLRPGETLTIEIKTDKTGVVVVRAPEGGTIMVEKSIPDLKDPAHVP